jgi:hypothetical protein
MDKMTDDESSEDELSEALPVKIAGKILLLIQAAPRCECKDCAALRFFADQLTTLVNQAVWVEAG